MSQAHRDQPYDLVIGEFHASIDYEPAESTTNMFGGNSNWRGPIWFPLNYLLVSSIKMYGNFFDESLLIEYPTASGQMRTLNEIAEDLRQRLISIFLLDADGRRPCYGQIDRFQNDPRWRDFVQFNEYFHGDNGAGLGASHQTGWTGVVADLIRRSPGSNIASVADLLQPGRAAIEDPAAPAPTRRTSMSDHYDFIIIGSGAGGGTLANALAASGKSILILERGDFLRREMDNWNPGAVFIDGKYQSADTWYDADDKPFQPQVHYFVGGATKMYGAALYRLRPQDFGSLTHVDGVSPAWPLSYDDLEPWYTKAEWLYQVHGNGGEDPTEGHRSKDYPWPAVSHEPRIQQLFDDLKAGGYHPFHAPCGILLDEAEPHQEHVHPLHLVRRLPLPGPRQVRRRDASPCARSSTTRT